MERTVLSKPVNVMYHGVTPEQSIFQIDSGRLGQSLTKLGFPAKARKPLDIIHEPSFFAEGGYDSFRRKIYINHKVITTNAIRTDHDLLRAIGDKPDPQKEERGILSDSKIFRVLFPGYWPYHLVKNKETRTFDGNPQRRANYLQRAKEGTLQPGVSPEDQKIRARRQIHRLSAAACKTDVSVLLAHEYEHMMHKERKAMIKYTLATLPIALGSALITEGNHLMQLAQLTTAEIQNYISYGVIAICVSSLIGLIKGRALEEQASFDAERNKTNEYRPSVSIHQTVFRREVLGEN